MRIRHWWSFVVAFGLHSALIYLAALRFSPWIVGRWFAWVAPVLSPHIGVSSADWYLQHLELVTIVPALVLGYVDPRLLLLGIRKDFASQIPIAAVWAWITPTLALAYRMIKYKGATSSVLFASKVSSIHYFFIIQKTMPTWKNIAQTDPVRVLAQMTITAPFYAGVAYSLGALIALYGWSHEKSQSDLLDR